MKIETYFKKNGYIYGVSSKFNFGQWNHYVKKFYNLDKAYEWLHTEEYDFRECELMSKTAVKNLCGNVNIDEE